jgi:Transglycosylase SLT domain
VQGLAIARELCAYRRMRTVLFPLFILALSITAHAAALQATSASTLCEQAIAKAEAIGHTPRRMLAAIGQVESGRPDPRTGEMRPWPGTIDAAGVGQFFATKAQAIAAVVALQAQGVRSIDVGCMQVNLMHHPDAFASLDQAFDPVSNTNFAVRFLAALYRSSGSWLKAIAAYHSDTPQIADDYQRRVLVTWQQHTATPVGGHLIYVGSGLIYGAFGSSGRIVGVILPGP